MMPGVLPLKWQYNKTGKISEHLGSTVLGIHGSVIKIEAVDQGGICMEMICP